MYRELIMKPMSGLTVLDISWHGPGVITAWLLAGMGARVIKVEPADGSDFVRNFGPKYGGLSLGQMAFDSGKESLALDLRTSGGQEVMRRLAAQSDVVIEGFRPGVANRLGIGYESLVEIRPSLVYCSVSGYPRYGNKADVAAHDLNYVADSGLFSLLVSESGTSPPPAQIADYVGAAMAAFAIAAGCLGAAVTGVGHYFEASLYDAARFTAVLSILHTRSGALATKVIGTQLAGSLACYGIYKCLDGLEVSVAALESKFWKRLCELMDLDAIVPLQLMPDKQFEIKESLKHRFSQERRDFWIALFENEDVCVTPVRSLEEAELFFKSMQSPDGKSPQVTESLSPDYPLIFPNSTDYLGLPPELGEHSVAILEEIGLNADQIWAFRQEGVIQGI